MTQHVQRINSLYALILCFLYMLCSYPAFGQDKIHRLSLSPDWLALGHYQTTLFGQYESTIDSSSFFLAPDGKTNPLAEIKASIDLFNTVTVDVKQKCLFPARYIFLKKQRLVDEPFPECLDYNQFKKDLNPNAITLIYTDAYMSNPSSLFGHTLIRIDVPKDKTQLVAHGMNYGAYVDEKTAGPLYAIYGLTGGYYGGFTVKPYYQIINTYNNMENRDIWEYTLNLTTDELDFFVAHLWEVGQTQTRYYFFTQNCSYLLTEVLDGVRPSLKLAKDFPLQTIPLDTVKAVYQRQNLISAVHYRPSRQRRIGYRYQQLSSLEQEALIDLLKEQSYQKMEQLTPEQQTAVLDLAYEYIQYQWVKQDIDLKDYRKNSFQILRKRKNIALTTPEIIIEGQNPVQAHDSMQVSFGIGSRQGDLFYDIGWRAAYHALTENPFGLLPGAEIKFLDTLFRYYPQTTKLQLQELNLIKITSLSPYNRLFQPISYQIDTYIKREFNPKTNREKLIYTLKGGSGLTVRPIRNLYVYGLVNTAFKYGGSHFPHHAGLSVGVSGGFIYYLPKIQIKTEMERSFSDNFMMNYTQIDSEINYSIAQNWQIGVSYAYQTKENKSKSTFKTGIYKFF